MKKEPESKTQERVLRELARQGGMSLVEGAGDLSAVRALVRRGLAFRSMLYSNAYYGAMYSGMQWVREHPEERP